MAFKLTKAETAMRDRLAADLRVAHEQVERTIGAYNDALQAARAFAEQRAAAWRDQHDGRSERWQRRDAGSAVDAFIDEWEGYRPDYAEVPQPDEIDEFEALPKAAGGEHVPLATTSWALIPSFGQTEKENTMLPLVIALAVPLFAVIGYALLSQPARERAQ